MRHFSQLRVSLFFRIYENLVIHTSNNNMSIRRIYINSAGFLKNQMSLLSQTYNNIELAFFCVKYLPLLRVYKISCTGRGRGKGRLLH